MRHGIAVVLGSAALLVVGQQPANGAVVGVIGSAFGYHAEDIQFGAFEPEDTGPEPVVALAFDGSNSPEEASQPTTHVTGGGVATLLTTDTVTVQASGSTGDGGTVTTTSTLTNVNKAASQPSITGSEILTADSVASSCTASESGSVLTTTITNGTLQTDSGLDLNADEDYLDEGEHAPVVVPIDTNPTPGSFIDGHIHVGSNIDNFRVVFNEQGTNLDGSMTVTAVHEILGTLAPDLITGNIYLGRSVCGVDAGVADLSVSVDDSAETVNTRSQFSYTVTVSNSGPDAASNVSVLTRLSGVKFVSASEECVVVKGRNSGIRCDFDSVDTGSSKSATITVAAPNKPGTVTATSTATSPNDPTGATGSDSTMVVKP